MGRVLVVGSVNEDVVAVVDRRPDAGETVSARDGRRSPGGKGANQAVASVRAGAATALVACVGDDAAGRGLVAALAGERVDVGGVLHLPGAPTGTALITVTADGENSIVVVAGANGLLDAYAATAAARELSAGDVLLAQLEIPLSAVVAAAGAASSNGARVVLNVTPVQPLPDQLLTLLDPIVVNETEAAGLLGRSLPLEETAAALVSLGARSAVVTGGARGAAAAWTGGFVTVSRPAPGPVVDTTGAGDALAGALAAGLAAGRDLAEAVAIGCSFAAVSVTRPGAWPSYPEGNV